MVAKKKPRRPVRQKKSDRMISPRTSVVNVKIDMALAPLTRAIEEADLRWGIDRLPELVSPETAEKWGLCMGKLNEAIDESDEKEAAKWAGSAMRGLAALEAEAEALGAVRASEDVWEVELNGIVYGIMRDGRSWQTIKQQRPDLKLLTLREVAVAIEWWQKHGLEAMVDVVKKEFPKAEVTGSTLGGNIEDEIKL